MEKEILQIISSLELQVWLMAGKVALAIIVALIAKGYLENIAAYYLFKANEDIGKRVNLKINGEKGRISGFNRKFIYIKLDSGYVRLIPITRWRYQTWDVQDVANNEEKKG